MKNPYDGLWRVAKPVNLLLLTLSYLLGVGIARYLGLAVDAIKVFSGWLIIFLAVVSSNMLAAYFAPAYAYPKNIENQGTRNSILRWLFYFALLALAACILIFFLLMFSYSLSQMQMLLLILVIALSLAIAIPPLRLEEQGYGELAMAILITGFALIAGFVLISGNFYRLVTYFSFPLTFLVFVYFLVLDFPTYGEDLLHQRMTLLIRLTWQRAIPVHNILLVISYLMFLAAPILGVPFSLVWPVLLTLPLAVYQIVMLRNISLGLKPNWRILMVNATALSGLAVYLLMFTFWIR